MVCSKPTNTINRHRGRACATFLLKSLIKGNINKPEIKKRIPANCNGVVYFNPILMAVKGVAHNKHANIAKKVVEKIYFFIVSTCDVSAPFFSIVLSLYQ